MRAILTLLTTFALTVAAFAGDPPTMADAGVHLNAQKWTEAIEVLDRIVADQPDNAQAVFYLAYATHMNGDIRAAIPLHKKAATFDAFRPVATYNLACAHALLDEKGPAIKALEKAVAAGFDNLEQIEGDEDFLGIQDDPAFEKLLAGLRERNAPVGERIDIAAVPVQAQFDFMAGEWAVTSSAGAGEVTAEKILKGRVLSLRGQNWAGLITYVPTLKVWKWTWVSDQGHHDVLVGGEKDGEVVLVQKVLRDRPNLIGKTVFKNIARDSFEMHWLVSADDGETWRPEYNARYVRKSSGSSAGSAAARAN